MTGLKGPWWTKERTHRLIKLIQVTPQLWDLANPGYKDKDLKRLSIEKIAQVLRLSPKEVKRKFHNLRCQMNCELRKVREKRDQGKGASIRWEFFDALKFLIMNREVRVECDEMAAHNSFRRFPMLEADDVIELNEDDEEDGEGQDFTVDQEQYEYENESHNETEMTQNLQEATSCPPLKKIKLKMTNTPTQLSDTEESMGPFFEGSELVPHSLKEDCDIFGGFVAMELRQIRSEEKRRKLKRIIQRAIIEVGEEDDADDSGPPNDEATTSYQPEDFVRVKLE